MLTWPPGRRETDGAWASYWYDAVEKSTGFQPYKRKDEQVPPEQQGLLDACLTHYHKLYEARLR